MTQRARPQRSRRTVRRPDAAEQPAVSSSVAAPVSATSARARSQPQPVVKITTTDYGYVVGELRRIGLLTAGMVALLIVLTFIIR